MGSASTTETAPGFRRLLPYFFYLKAHWFSFLGALLCGAVYGLSSGFGLPYMIDQIFPKIFPTDPTTPTLPSWEIFWYVAWFPAVFLIRGVSSYANSYLINYCGMRVLEKIRLDVFKKLQSLPISFFNQNKSGDLLSRVMGDTGQLQSAVLAVSNDLIKQPITFIGAISALCVMAVQREGMAFVLFCLLVIPICVFPIRRVGELLMSKALGMQQQAGGLTAILSENLSGPAEIRAFNLKNREVDRFQKAADQFFTARMKVIKYAHLLTPLIEIITATGISIAIFQAAKTSIHLDAVVPVIVALYMSYEPIKKLGTIHNKVKEGLASLTRLNHILSAEESVRNAPKPQKIKAPKGKITFDRVSYSYPSSDQKTPSPPALSEISFTAEAGEIIALVGPSGAGKSTLAGLIPRFHDPSSGSVTIDGISLRELDLHALREMVALVPQKPFLFDASVRENIELGHSSFTNCPISDALDSANALEFVSSMKNQEDEILGERGSRLSGGQLQRLALARAFYRNSPILILDEATSALDTENEEKIHTAMSRLIQGKTTFLIAHRFSSIRLADRILVLEHGKIIADGPHSQIYGSCELYRNLYDNQAD